MCLPNHGIILVDRDNLDLYRLNLDPIDFKWKRSTWRGWSKVNQPLLFFPIRLSQSTFLDLHFHISPNHQTSLLHLAYSAYWALLAGTWSWYISTRLNRISFDSPTKFFQIDVGLGIDQVAVNEVKNRIPLWTLRMLELLERLFIDWTYVRFIWTPW